MAQELVPRQDKLPGSCGPILDSLLTHGKHFELWKCGDIPVITDALKVAAEQGRLFIEARLAPAQPDWIKGAIVTLLTHYYVADLPEHVHAAVSSDWLEDLQEYPAWAISEARTEWRQNNKRKPTPGHMRELCNKAVSKDKAMLRQCVMILDARITPEPEPELTEEEITVRDEEINQVVADAKKHLTEGWKI